MRAVVFERYGEPAEVREVEDPEPAEHGVVVRVEATGLCRSDWHGWMGHDPDITLPHVPGHELAGVVESVGADVTTVTPGQFVVGGFLTSDNTCVVCRAGAQANCRKSSDRVCAASELTPMLGPVRPRPAPGYRFLSLLLGTFSRFSTARSILP